MFFSRSKFLLAIQIALGAFTLVVYFRIFNDCIDFSFNCTNFTLPYNTPDHKIYAAIIENYNEMSWWLPFLSNHGIAVIYYYIFLLLGVAEKDYYLATLWINIAIYIYCTTSYLQLVEKLQIEKRRAFLFFLYPPFLFLSALINKDIIITLLVIRLAIALLEKKQLHLFALSLIFCSIRTQYILLPLMTWFMMGGRIWHRIFFVYVLTSFMTAAIARYSHVFEVDFEAAGLTTFIYEFNKKYMIGSLVFNPLRALHYILAFANQWVIFLKNGVIDLMKLIEGITFFWFLMVMPGCFRFFKLLTACQDQVTFRLIGSIILGFFFLLLLTSITEVRYLTPLFPILLLASNITNSVNRKLPINGTGRQN